MAVHREAGGKNENESAEKPNCFSLKVVINKTTSRLWTSFSHWKCIFDNRLWRYLRIMNRQRQLNWKDTTDCRYCGLCPKPFADMRGLFGNLRRIASKTIDKYILAYFQRKLKRWYQFWCIQDNDNQKHHPSHQWVITSSRGTRRLRRFWKWF